MSEVPSSGPERDRAYDDRHVHAGASPGGHPAAAAPGTRHEPEPAFEGPLHALSRAAWQVVLLTGVGSLVLGVLVLVWPGPSLVAAGVLFGLYLLYSGVLQLVSAFGTHRATSLRVLAFISGALSILLGLFCFRGPMQSILLLALWIGIGWLFRGITQTVAAVHDPRMPARGWQIFLGIVTFVAGIVLIDSPLESVSVLTLVSGIWLVAVGIVEIVTAFGIRGRARRVPQTV
ncbi:MULTISPECIES: HdeD family acid-resistance protein [Streptomyces]|uniref:HdeD family acid-resistance protein n=1 Tax=Streptomyces argyrophylli TaxID=2726118 RepID=A0A6M4PJ91_9ACTN|nr:MULTISPECIES: HdeD family acid-resistance protein [Streptomyces]QJS11161.1 HdeD family acid-resistance protein [Streptomyces argyrophyllae]